MAKFVFTAKGKKVAQINESTIGNKVDTSVHTDIVTDEHDITNKSVLSRTEINENEYGSRVSRFRSSRENSLAMKQAIETFNIDDLTHDLEQLDKENENLSKKLQELEARLKIGGAQDDSVTSIINQLRT